MALGMIPSWFIKDSMSMKKIWDLEKQFPNDSDFGREIRNFLRDLKDGKVYNNGSDLEFDEPARPIEFHSRDCAEPQESNCENCVSQRGCTERSK